MDVSIIIVSWNTRGILRDCLNSVYLQAGQIDFEVIVVDNASTDGSAEMVRRNFPDVRLIENAENRGFARANNQGMDIAEGRYFLMLNSDTLVLDSAVEKVVHFAESRSDAAVLGCRILNSDMSVQPSCFMFPSALNLFLAATYLYKVFPKSRFFGRARMTWWDGSDVKQVDAVTGCFMLVRKSAVDEVGMMDEQLFMYGEEADWCYRFKKAGYEVVFTPRAQIVHLGGASSRQVKPGMIKQWRRSTLMFFKKHKSVVSYSLARLFIFMFFSTRIPYWMLRGALAKTSDGVNG